MNLREPFTFNMRAAFQELMDRPDADRLAAYRDPAWRARAWEEMQGQRGALPRQLRRARGRRDRRRTPSSIDRKVTDSPPSAASPRST